MIPRQRSSSQSGKREWVASISRSLGRSHGTAGGRDECLEVTSEQRDETERVKKLWEDEWQRWIARGNAERNTKTSREKRLVYQN